MSELKENVVNVCVVGFGLAGKSFHCYLVSLVKSLRLYCVVVRSPESQAQVRALYPAVVVYGSLDEALNDPLVQLVVVASPSGEHTSMALQALSKGKDVVVDKPMALTLADCDRMIEAAEKSGRLLTAFQNRRWDGDFLTAKQLMKDNKLGRVKWLEMAYQKGFTTKAWKAESLESGGGRFYDLGVHLIDQLLNFFEDKTVSNVYSRIMFDNPQMPRIDSHVLVIVEFSDGTTGVLDVNSMTTIQKDRFYVVGDKATFVKRPMDTDIQEAAMVAGNISAGLLDEEKDYGFLRGVGEKDSTRVPTLPGQWTSYYENLAQTLLQRYAAEARNDTEQLKKLQPPVTPASVRRTIAVLDAAIKSMREHRVVDLNLSSIRSGL